MCGIAGCFHDTNLTCEVHNARQLELLRRRGPDSAGTFANPGSSIGQSRLAIIDLITGDPPLTNEDGTIAAVMNGEIYNFHQLRDQLVREGHTFTSTCDTEVLAHLAEDRDPEAIARSLEGMFAFAIFDIRRQRLIIGRDRFGVKPLYYWSCAGNLVFGSEPKAVLAHPGVPRDLNKNIIPTYLAHGYAPTPDTFYAGIRAVPPAHVLVASHRNEPSLRRFWTSPLLQADSSGLASTGTLTMNQASSQVRTLLDAAVARRLEADVPLGAFLSGGIDSSAVVALMAQQAPSSVRTFTIGFDDTQGYDERPYAKLLATRYKTDHTEFVVDPTTSDLIEELVELHDGPFGDSSALPTFLLSKLTRGEVTVALCGDGGDEIFAGYERFAGARILCTLQSTPKPLTNIAQRVIRSASKHGDFRLVLRAERMLRQASDKPEVAFVHWMDFVDRTWISRLGPGTPLDKSFLASFERSGGTLLQRLQQANIDTYLLDDLLPKVDRMSMAHGLEVRSPFLDRELAEFALCLPDRFKVRGLTLKRVLKRAVSDLLPAEILRRGKRGFGLPLDRWFREDLRSFLESRLLAPSSALRNYVNPEALSDLVAEHMAGIDHGHALWTLLTLEVFLRREGWT